jgi:UDP-N-acetylglucosamine transferase subunit ALG13
MILVSVGTNEARFDRLLLAVDRLAWDEPLFVQHGPSSVRPGGAECVDYLPFDTLVEKIRQSRVFITHAGVGSLMVALAAGRRPVVVPRRRRYGEAVDDHQVSLARRMEAAGLVTLVDDPAESLGRAMSVANRALLAAAKPTMLKQDLRAYLVAHCRGNDASPGKMSGSPLNQDAIVGR